MDPGPAGPPVAWGSGLPAGIAVGIAVGNGGPVHVSGGYHLPSEANHHPGPCDASLMALRSLLVGPLPGGATAAHCRPAVARDEGPCGVKSRTDSAGSQNHNRFPGMRDTPPSTRTSPSGD